MHKNLTTAALVATLLSLSFGLPARAAVEAAQAFDRIKTFEGTWQGTTDGKGEAEAEAEQTSAAIHRFEVSAGGTVVMETMSPGTEYEMINMYHVDGDDLLVTHYCSSGNQPRMRLNRGASSADHLVFDFDGGTNLDPALDHHIHSAEIRIVADDRMDSVWHGYSGGKPVGEMAFRLARTDD